MIYNSTITNVNESDIMSLLENAEDRFEYYTMAEATAITVAEQEENWTRFMKGIGLSELSTVMEGQEVVYEGARLKGFIEKAKAFFKMALNKLAELTKRFMAKIDQIFKTNDSFVKKYGSTLEKMDQADVNKALEGFKGYKFENMENPKYAEPAKIEITAAKAETIANDDTYTKEHAEDILVPGSKDGSFSERLTIYFYGSKEKIELNNINLKEQLGYMKETKKLKQDAKKSYTEAAKKIKTFIKELEKAEREALKNPGDDQTLKQGQYIDQAYSKVISYWKAYSNGAHQKHGTYMRALGARNAQARAICTRAINAGHKAAGKGKREELKAKTEGFINTDAFLGAVEFI